MMQDFSYLIAGETHTITMQIPLSPSQQKILKITHQYFLDVGCESLKMSHLLQVGMISSALYQLAS